MHVLISGSTGMIGSRLVGALRERGDRVTRLVRRAPAPADGVVWDPAAGVLDPGAFRGVDAVVHLAGENIAGGRWTKERKRRILQSRVDGTRLVAEKIAAASERPALLLQASAVGVYGDRGDEVLTEESASGTGFLADTCRAWEAASTPAEAAGVRVARLRFGIVMSSTGGVLGKMLLPFLMGVGGVVGDGRQYLSWITLDDLVRVIERTLDDPTSAGVYNAVAPNPVQNRELTKILGRVLHRPTVLPLPKFGARLLLGTEMANELLLASTRVVPARLTGLGHTFADPELEPALRRLLPR
jgi:uncharacterized protein (TIGR01777 family)